MSDTKKQEVLALGRLGWTLRRIEAATGVRRETAGRFQIAAGVAVRPPGRWGHPPARPASEGAIDPASPALEGATLPAPPAAQLSADREAAPPRGVDLVAGPPPGSRAPTASACEPYRELIDLALGGGRNAMGIWQDLVDQHGFPGRSCALFDDGAHFVCMEDWSSRVDGAALQGDLHHVVVEAIGVLTPDAEPTSPARPGGRRRGPGEASRDQVFARLRQKFTN